MKRVHEVIPGAVAELLRDAPLSPGKVRFAWRLAVGPALERATVVDLDGRTLVVQVETRQWAREVHRSSSMILKRLERWLGEGAVASLDVRFARLDAARAERPVPHPKAGV